MAEIDLFSFWAASISGGSIFLTLVSIYLYANTRKRRKQAKRESPRTGGFIRDFAFVWVLLSLLVFYILTILLTIQGSLVFYLGTMQVGPAGVFAIGNVIVEALLVLYLVKNRTADT